MTAALPRPGVVVYARDLDKVAAFYRQVARLTVEASDDDFVILGTAYLEVAVVRVPDSVAATYEVESPPRRREDTATKTTLPVTSLAEARVTAAAAGGVVDPVEREWTFQGCVRCDGHDPEGNVVQLVQVWVAVQVEPDR